MTGVSPEDPPFAVLIETIERPSLPPEELAGLLLAQEVRIMILESQLVWLRSALEGNTDGKT
jgi:hypothetical protein